MKSIYCIQKMTSFGCIIFQGGSELFGFPYSIVPSHGHSTTGSSFFCASLWPKKKMSATLFRGFFSVCSHLFLLGARLASSPFTCQTFPVFFLFLSFTLLIYWLTYCSLLIPFVCFLRPHTASNEEMWS